MAHPALSSLLRYPLVAALLDRRSRRFGRGMRMDDGPLAYRSRLDPVRLSEDEEALLAFAACGVTGHALGDLMYGQDGGGTIMAGMLGRTAASGDAIHCVSVFVVNEDATYLLKRPRDFPPSEISELARLAKTNAFTELYRRSRVKIREGRVEPPRHLFHNLNVNRWSLYDPAATYFLPVNELTLLYINGVLEIFREENAAFIVDERAGFRPAGIKAFARSRGGHLEDNPKAERTLTIQQLEALVTEFVTIEQGMILQNLALMTQALGLGGFPHWAAHPYGWLEALGFRMQQIPATRYLGMNWLAQSLARLLGRDLPVAHALGLEREGTPLLAPFCPPWFSSMTEAVQAVAELKFGPDGVFREQARNSSWQRPENIVAAVERPSAATVAATSAYCEYVYRRYGRFPAYPPPFRTVLGFQANHVDHEFYEAFYKPEALSDTQRSHMKEWHPH